MPKPLKIPEVLPIEQHEGVPGGSQKKIEKSLKFSNMPPILELQENSGRGQHHENRSSTANHRCIRPDGGAKFGCVIRLRQRQLWLGPRSGTAFHFACAGAVFGRAGYAAAGSSPGAYHRPPANRAEWQLSPAGRAGGAGDSCPHDSAFGGLEYVRETGVRAGKRIKPW
jgi:hypothetical protein